MPCELFKIKSSRDKLAPTEFGNGRENAGLTTCSASRTESHKHQIPCRSELASRALQDQKLARQARSYRIRERPGKRRFDHDVQPVGPKVTNTKYPVGASLLASSSRSKAREQARSYRIRERPGKRRFDHDVQPAGAKVTDTQYPVGASLPRELFKINSSRASSLLQESGLPKRMEALCVLDSSVLAMAAAFFMLR